MDFDNDRKYELLLIKCEHDQSNCLNVSSYNQLYNGSKKQSFICAEIYEVEKRKVVKKDKCKLFLIDETTDGYCDIIIFEFNKKIHIGCGSYRVAFWGNGIDAGMGVVTYSGSEFVKTINEHWYGSGDEPENPMYGNVYDSLKSHFNIEEEFVFSNDDWIYKYFDLVQNVLEISFNPYYQDEQKRFVKLSVYGTIYLYDNENAYYYNLLSNIYFMLSYKSVEA